MYFDFLNENGDLVYFVSSQKAAEWRIGMKTKQVPAIVMLAAGFCVCIIAFMRQMEAKDFLKTLLLTLIVFYFIGGVAKLVLDPFFKPEEAPPGEEVEQGEEGQEAAEPSDEMENAEADETVH